MKVAVLGAGTMGSGIAQLAAMNGFDVSIYDVDTPALDRAQRSMDHSLERFVAKEVLTDVAATAVLEGILATTDLPKAVESADIVVEAVPEDLDLKRKVFANVIAAAPDTALLGTNTSQLSITAIGSGLGSDAARLVGTHFFNPPVLMKLVEIVRGDYTSDETVQRAREFAEALNREVVVIEKDSPGFITTRVSAIVRLECLRILEEGVATAADIDKACRLGLNFPMGPIELGDFNGLDTYLKALESLEIAHGDRFTPTAGLREKVDAGHLGRKSQQGYYRYDDKGRPTDGAND